MTAKKAWPFAAGDQNVTKKRVAIGALLVVLLLAIVAAIVVPVVLTRNANKGKNRSRQNP